MSDDLHDKLKANKQKAMSDWSQLNHQVVGGEVFPMADHEKIESLKAEVVKLREELEKLKVLKSANGAEGNCISNTLHRRSRQMTEAGWGYDAHIMESGAQYLELEVEKSRKYYRALAAAKEALEKDWDALTEFGQISDETRVGLAIKSNREALAFIAECEKMG